MNRTGTAALEFDLVVRAARSAPVYGVGHPWVLEPHGSTVSLYELPHHSLQDRLGFDRLLSCGAVLHNVHTTMRNFGWHVGVELPRDVARPDLLAMLTAGDRQAPTVDEVDDYEAIDEPTSSGRIDLPALAASNHWAGVRLQPLEDDVGLAELGLPKGSAALLVLTAEGGRQDVLLAGAAMQAARLRARARGMRTARVRGARRPPQGAPGHLWALLVVRSVT